MKHTQNFISITLKTYMKTCKLWQKHKLFLFQWSETRPKKEYKFPIIASLEIMFNYNKQTHVEHTHTHTHMTQQSFSVVVCES